MSCTEKIDLELPDSLNFEDPDKLKEELDKLKEELDKLNEEFDKRNEGRYNFLEIMEKTHDLISQAEKDVLIVDDQSYEITLKAVQELAKVFMYQNFKKNLDNITERALFSCYLSLATSNFAMNQNNSQQMLHCLCNAYSTYGSTLSIDNSFINYEINKNTLSFNNARFAKIRAEKISQQKAPKLKELEEIWDNENWNSKGRGKFTKFANHIIRNNTFSDLSFETIKNYISRYNKNK